MAAITAPVTFAIFGNANRQAGTHVTGSATIPEGVDAIGLRDNMTDALAGSASNAFTLTLQVSRDGGATWQSVHQEEWQGGTFVNKFTGLSQARHIDYVWSTTELRSGLWAGWLSRAVLVLPSQLRVGFDLTAYPAPGV